MTFPTTSLTVPPFVTVLIPTDVVEGVTDVSMEQTVPLLNVLHMQVGAAENSPAVKFNT